MIPLSWYLFLAFILIGMGAYGMMVKRNLIRILIGAEIMGNGVNIALVAVSMYGNFSFVGQGLIILVISVAAAHTALAMVLMLMYNRRYNTVDLGTPISLEDDANV
ncbi:MAG: NADH-quinone oxidoreductase subunit K [Candidatus Thorarchaeota archaeon]